MTFFERYEKICELFDEKPISQTSADRIGVSKATISIWKKKSTTPKAETVQRIADSYGVSINYLLGTSEKMFEDKAVKNEKSVKATQKRTAESTLQKLINQLDKEDIPKVEAYIKGILSAKGWQ